jgi:hypothetical protein
MIRFIRTGRYSLDLEFDSVGAKTLISVFQLALKCEEPLVDVEPDSTFRKNAQVKKFKVICNEQENKIYYSSSTVTLELDSDCLEYGIKRLNDCVLGKEFYPAEFCDVVIEKRREELTLYGKFCKNETLPLD